MLRRLFFALFLTLTTLASAEEQSDYPYKANSTDVRIVPVQRTPESETVKLRIYFPEKGEVKMKEPVRIQVHTDGFPLAVNSLFARNKEIWNDPEGQSVHVVVDNYPYFSFNYANIKSLDSRDNFYTEITEITLPFELAPGEHVIRAFPVRSYNESLKDRGNFVVERFYFQKKENTLDQNLKGPFLTYNEPKGGYDYDPEEPILLDFYITNTQLSGDGYKVEFSIDGKVERILTLWTPYYIYGLQKGKHTVRLRLLDPQNKQVHGIFNDVSETITIK